jgi:hypothetical protein
MPEYGNIRSVISSLFHKNPIKVLLHDPAALPADEELFVLAEEKAVWVRESV